LQRKICNLHDLKSSSVKFCNGPRWGSGLFSLTTHATRDRARACLASRPMPPMRSASLLPGPGRPSWPRQPKALFGSVGLVPLAWLCNSLGGNDPCEAHPTHSGVGPIQTACWLLWPKLHVEFHGPNGRTTCFGGLWFGKPSTARSVVGSSWGVTRQGMTSSC
jgi:hypothetical protein